jgi:quinol monooxygenase YgiN
MIIYEVTLRVNRAIAEDYRQWLDEHVQEMLQIEGFIDAVIEQQIDPAETGYEIWCTRYRLRDQQDLDNYLQRHAPRMRAEGLQRFGNQFSATRRVLRSDQSF